MEWRQMNMIDSLIETWKPPEVLTKYYSIDYYSILLLLHYTIILYIILLYITTRNTRYYSMGTTGQDKLGCTRMSKWLK